MTFPNLEKVALCRRYPKEPSSTLHAGHHSYMLRGAPFVGYSVGYQALPHAVAASPLMVWAWSRSDWLWGPRGTRVDAGPLVVSKSSALIGYQENSKMALASISVPVVEQAPKDCYHQHLCLHRESQLSPASL